MDSRLERCAIFCTAEIPPATIEKFLEAVVEYREESDNLFSDEPMDTADELALITSKDLSTIHHGLSSPVESFTSPFVGMSVDEVTSWFISNIQETEVFGYTSLVFIVLDEDSVIDEVCTIVCLLDDPSGTLHCEFQMALDVVCQAQHTALETLEAFSRSDMVLTKENAWMNDRIRVDGMDYDFWRGFYKKYAN